MSQRIHRRTFVKSIAVAGATMPIVWPNAVRAQSANKKLNVAFVGAGGRAGAHTGQMHKMGQNCVAFTEVDKTRWGGVHGKKGWEQAKGYTDWRKMFDAEDGKIDARGIHRWLERAAAAD